MHQWFIKTPLFQCPELHTGTKQLEVASNTHFGNCWTSDWSAVANRQNPILSLSHFLEASDLCDRFLTLLPGSGTWAWAHSAFYHFVETVTQLVSCGYSRFTSETLRVLPKPSDFPVVLLHENSNPEDWAAKMKSEILYVFIYDQSEPAAVKMFVTTWFDPAGSGRRGHNNVLFHFR